MYKSILLLTLVGYTFISFWFIWSGKWFTRFAGAVLGRDFIGVTVCGNTGGGVVLIGSGILRTVLALSVVQELLGVFTII